MKLTPEAIAANVAVVDARTAFAVVRGGVACNNCGARLDLVDLFEDARRMRHSRGCELGRAIAASSKPVLFPNRRIVSH